MPIRYFVKQLLLPPGILLLIFGFFGSRPFSKANAFLEQHGRGAIDWRV